MKKRFIKYNSINTGIKTVLKNINYEYNYTDELNEDGTPIYLNRELPILVAHGTEKIHGTNAAFCYNHDMGHWHQSRERILYPDGPDNSNCHRDNELVKDSWLAIVKQLSEFYNIDLNDFIISIYYEWSGGKIQKKSAVTGLDKMAIIFAHFKVSPKIVDLSESPGNQNKVAFWLPTTIKDEVPVSSEDHNIYNILNGRKWKVNIDPFHIAKTNENLINLLHEIEDNSPFGNVRGVENNTAEGMVYTILFNGQLHKFKIKGEKHTNSKVKKINTSPEAIEKEKKVAEFCNEVVTGSRCEQGWQFIFGIENEIKEPDVKYRGEFLRWIYNDVKKEHQDLLQSFNLIEKDVNTKISIMAKNWFSAELKTQSI